jgi:hypothetical protein
LSDYTSRVRRTISMWSGPVAFMFAVGTFLAFMYLANQPKSYIVSSLQGLGLLVGFTLAVGLFLLKMSFDFTRNSFITLSSRNRVNFFKRNKDSILVGLIAATFTAILTLIFAKV